jgi:hypothetical protein
VVSLFCRHNRFTADCPICSKGTVLDAPSRGESRTRTPPTPAGRTAARTASGERAQARSARPATARAEPAFRGPYAAAGPYERDGDSYEVRLERVPGGLRLAEWTRGQLRPSAPVLAAQDIGGLVHDAAGSGALAPGEHDELARAVTDVPPEPRPAHAVEAPPEAGASGYGASPGRSGELRDELRVERLEAGRLRVARWVLRPGTGWDLLDAPTMLPARRYAEALADAGRRGLLRE